MQGGSEVHDDKFIKIIIIIFVVVVVLVVVVAVIIIYFENETSLRKNG